MRYNKLGRTGLFVSELCLGTMTFGGGDDMWGKIGQLGQDDADALVRVAIDGGINFIDTANVYSNGRSEEITGQAIRNLGLKREEIVVATKAFGEMGAGPNARGASRYHLIDACKASLKRLQLDHIDLYQIHGFDPATPIEETLRALDTLVQHGHVRYIGISNWAAWQIVKALGESARLGLHRFKRGNVLAKARGLRGVQLFLDLAGQVVVARYPGVLLGVFEDQRLVGLLVHLRNNLFLGLAKQ